jgi:outer membrane lipoprotein-sorting protein
MKMIKSLVLAFAILSPTVSYAFTAGDIKADDMVKEHQRKVTGYAVSQNKSVPKVIEYKYGMALDVAQVVFLSPDPRACKVLPQLMTYEDSEGELNTLKYQMLSECRGKN